MADIVSEILAPFTSGLDLTTIGIVALACVGIVIAVILFKKIKDNRAFDILVEVTPMWGFNLSNQNETEVKQPSAFGKMLGMKEQVINKQFENLTHQTYFVAGAYVFDKNTGNYELKLKDKDKTKIQGIPYDFFTPVLYGKFKRVLKLLRYSPHDYKACKVRFNGIDEIRHVYDNEATYIAIKTQEEIANRFSKKSKLEKYVPMIMMIVMVLMVIVAVYINNRGLEKVTAGLREVATSLQTTIKYAKS